LFAMAPPVIFFSSFPRHVIAFSPDCLGHPKMNQYLELDSEGLAEFLPPSSSQMPKKALLPVLASQRSHPMAWGVMCNYLKFIIYFCYILPEIHVCVNHWPYIESNPVGLSDSGYRIPMQVDTWRHSSPRTALELKILAGYCREARGLALRRGVRAKSGQSPKCKEVFNVIHSPFGPFSTLSSFRPELTAEEVISQTPIFSRSRQIQKGRVRSDNRFNNAPSGQE
jgi:hypothetical protein